MKWPWRTEVHKAPENRGTITFTADHRIILGVPHGTTQDVAETISAALRTWDDTRPGYAVFPFPVDVIDQRGRK